MTEISNIKSGVESGRRIGIYARTFAGLLARDTRVLRRDFMPFLLRTVMNPIMFTFIFAYVFPKIGESFGSGGGFCEFRHDPRTGARRRVHNLSGDRRSGPASRQ